MGVLLKQCNATYTSAIWTNNRWSRSN